MKVQLKGWPELERALAEELPRATAKNVLRKSMITAMGRIESSAKAKAPVDDGELRDSITTKAAKAKRQKGSVRFERQTGLEVLTGPSVAGKLKRANASWQEYGTVKMQPNAYMRPAADSEGQNVVDGVIAVLTDNIEKAKARIARKAAKVK